MVIKESSVNGQKSRSPKSKRTLAAHHGSEPSSRRLNMHITITTAEGPFQIEAAWLHGATEPEKTLLRKLDAKKIPLVIHPAYRRSPRYRSGRKLIAGLPTPQRKTCLITLPKEGKQAYHVQNKLHSDLSGKPEREVRVPRDQMQRQEIGCRARGVP